MGKGGVKVRLATITLTLVCSERFKTEQGGVCVWSARESFCNDGGEESGCGTENFYKVLTKLIMGVRPGSAPQLVTTLFAPAQWDQGATCVVSRVLRGNEPWVASVMFLGRGNADFQARPQRCGSGILRLSSQPASENSVLPERKGGVFESGDFRCSATR